jgi:16S rRNA (guanine1207-N2)-methyltransferase
MSSPPIAREIFPPHYFSPQAPAPLPEYSRRALSIRVAGVTLQMTTGDGVFSKDHLDAGSHVLLENIVRDAAWSEANRICDLGCGWGAVGCFLAARFPEARVSMCDINARATHLAAFNAAHNTLLNVRAWCGDGLSAARDEYFNAVACNPPIRAGNATISKMFDGAHRCLASGGVLSIVIRTAQGAKSWHKRLESLFGNCQTVAVESGYRVLKCIK